MTFDEKDAASAALSRIADDVETFLDAQLLRIEALLDECQAVAGGQAARERLREETDRRRWEEQRRRVTRELEEQAETLAEAWSRLEAERRSLLQARQALQLSGRTEYGAAQSTSGLGGAGLEGRGNGDTISGTVRATVYGPTEQMQAASERKEATPSRESPSRELMVRQFQQLSREIGRHTREAWD